jgi:hypothetical protein
VVHHEQRVLEPLVDRIEAECLRHWGRDLNPSFDYKRGDEGVLQRELIERPEEEPYAFGLLEISEIRRRVAVGAKLREARERVGAAL